MGFVPIKNVYCSWVSKQETLEGFLNDIIGSGEGKKKYATRVEKYNRYKMGVQA